MLEIDLNKELASNNISKAVKIRQEIDALSDTVETNDKEKGSFFGRLKESFTKTKASSEGGAASESAPENKYKGLLSDCGTCSSCNPPASEKLYKHLSAGVCDQRIPMPVNEVTSSILSRSHAFRTSERIEELQNRVASVLEDPSKSSLEGGASIAANEVRDMLWDEHSEKNGNKDTSRGGFASASTTSDLFYALGREKELGWIEQDAPGYDHRVERNLRSDDLFSSMQQLLSESPSSYARKHPAPKNK